MNLTAAPSVTRLARPAPRDTRERILDAAERLFADGDFDSVSTRDIVKAAGVNIAAVNYHFGGKLELYRAVFMRRLEPANRSRLERLDAAEREAGGRPLPVRGLLEIILAPMIEVASSSGEDAPAFMRLMARTLMMPHPEIAADIETELAPVRRRFLAALSRSLPGLGPDALLRRFRFVFGATLASFGTLPSVATRPWSRLTAAERDAQVRDLLNFLEAGLKAP